MKKKLDLSVLKLRKTPISMLVAMFLGTFSTSSMAYLMGNFDSYCNGINSCNKVDDLYYVIDGTEVITLPSSSFYIENSFSTPPIQTTLEVTGNLSIVGGDTDSTPGLFSFNDGGTGFNNSIAVLKNTGSGILRIQGGTGGDSDGIRSLAPFGGDVSIQNLGAGEVVIAGGSNGSNGIFSLGANGNEFLFLNSGGGKFSILGGENGFGIGNASFANVTIKNEKGEFVIKASSTSPAINVFDVASSSSSVTIFNANGATMRLLGSTSDDGSPVYAIGVFGEYTTLKNYGYLELNANSIEKICYWYTDCGTKSGEGEPSTQVTRQLVNVDPSLVVTYPSSSFINYGTGHVDAEVETLFEYREDEVTKDNVRQIILYKETGEETGNSLQEGKIEIGTEKGWFLKDDWFYNSVWEDGGTITFTNSQYNESILKQFEDAFNTDGNTTKVSFSGDENSNDYSSEYEVTSTQEFVINVAAINSASQANPGAILLQSFESDMPNLVIGSDASIKNSFGFLSLTQVDSLTVENGETLRLIGNGSDSQLIRGANDSADTEISVNNGSLILGAAESFFTTVNKDIEPGGVLESLKVRNSSVLENPFGKYTIESLETDSRTTINVDGQLTLGKAEVSGTLTNKGKVFAALLNLTETASAEVADGALLRVTSLNGDGKITVGNGGTLVVDTLTNAANISYNDGGETIVIGEKAVQWWETNQAGDDYENPLATISTYSRSRSAVSSETAPDLIQTTGFATVGLGGIISGNHIYSGSSSNPTWAFKADSTTEVKSGASLRILDQGYVLSGSQVNVDQGASVALESDSTVVVQGSLSNKGVIASDTDSGTIYVVGDGQLSSEGADSKISIQKLQIQDNGVVSTSDGAELSFDTVTISGNGQLSVDDTTASFKTNELTLKDGAQYQQSQKLTFSRLTVANGIYSTGGHPSEVAKNNITLPDVTLAFLSGDPETPAMDVSDKTVIVGSYDGSVELNAGDVYFGENSALVIDAERLSAIFNGKSDRSGSIYVKLGSQLIVNAATWGLHCLVSENLQDKLDAGAWEGDYLIDNTGIEGLAMRLVRTSAGDLLLEVGKKTKGNDIDDRIQALSDEYSVPEVINALIDTEEGSLLRDPLSEYPDVAFVSRVLDYEYVPFGIDSNGNYDVTESARLWNSVVNIGAVSGLNAYSMDMNRQIADAVEAHAGSYTDLNMDRNLWVQILGNTSRANSLKAELPSKIGYKAKSYGLIFGADILNSHDASLGLAFNYVKGSIDSKGNYLKTDSDAKIWGLNLYGAKQFGAAKVSGLFSYQYSDGKANQSYTDLMGNGYGFRSDIDSKSLIFGVRGEYAFDLDKVSIKPHAGIRYIYTKFEDNSVKINGQKAFDVSTKNKSVFSIPLGIAVEGKFKADAWNLKPAVDLSVIPQFGRKSTEATVSARHYNGVDSMSYNVTGNFLGELALGLEAQNKAHTFSIYYKGAVGDQGRSSHSLNAVYRFSF